mgnify:CR=1 FL=1
MELYIDRGRDREDLESEVEETSREREGVRGEGIWTKRGRVEWTRRWIWKKRRGQNCGKRKTKKTKIQGHVLT